MTILLLFCLTSSLTYLWNDLRDAESDRRHPRKARRPIAAGRIAPAAGGTVLAAGLVLLAVLTLSLHPRGLPFLAAYLLLNTGYSLGLKRVPVLDLLLITAGFVIRVLAGTHAVQVPTSAWIVLCTGALAFFLAVAKRRLDLPDNGSEADPTFRGYNPAFLDQLLTMSAGWTVLFYGLYCSELNQKAISSHSFLWTLPFVLYGVLHYLRRVQALKGSGRSLLLDPPLAAAVAGWMTASWLVLR